jgi:hypothetical protein
MSPQTVVVPDKNLTRTYALVVVVEIVVIAALFWLGKYFG